VQRVVVHPGVRIVAEGPERRERKRERSAAWEHVRCSEEQSARARARDGRGQGGQSSPGEREREKAKEGDRARVGGRH
jgi:hypothetical protein